MRKLDLGVRIAVFAVVLAFLLMPWVYLLRASISQAAFLGSVRPGLSVQWYVSVFSSARWWSAAASSLVISVGAGTLATVLGSAAAITLHRRPVSVRVLVSVLLLLPLTVPPIIQALGLRSIYWSMVPSTLLIIGGASLQGLPLVYIFVATAAWSTNPRLLWAGESLGVTGAALMRKVMLPQCSSAMVIGWLLACFMAFDDVIFAVVLGKPGNRTLGRLVWETVQQDATPATAAASVIWLLFAVAVYLFVLRRLLRSLVQMDITPSG